MNNKSILLLKNLFLSTGDWNAFKYADGKEKRKIVGRIIGYALLGLYLGALAGFLSWAMAAGGFGDMVPVLLAFALCFVSLLFTLLKAGGYLYGFKEYDMIMSMPFSVPTIVSSRFLLMYLRDLRTDIFVSVASLIGYSLGCHPSPQTYVVWLVMTPFIPLIPTVIGALIGAFVARIGSNMKHKSLVQTVLIYIFVIPMFFTNYIVNYVISSNKMGAVMNQGVGVASGITTYFPNVRWFADAINKGSISSFLLFLGVSLLIYVVAVALISRSFRRINSALESHGVRKKAKIGTKEYRKKSVVQTIIVKEFKRFTGSTVCATNICMGTVMALLFGVIFLIVKGEDILVVFTHGYKPDIRPYITALPMLIYFFVGMMPSTVVSPSLEGKNAWIIQTLPVKPATICSAKMLFNILLVLPAALFATIAGCISFRAAWPDIIFCIFLMTLLCTFSTVYGMRCGLKHVKLDWENETEVVKRGPAVNFYMMPNMFGTMILVGVAIFLATRFDMRLIMLGVFVLYLLLTIVSYASLRKYVAKA